MSAGEFDKDIDAIIMHLWMLRPGAEPDRRWIGARLRAIYERGLKVNATRKPGEIDKAELGGGKRVLICH